MSVTVGGLKFTLQRVIGKHDINADSVVLADCTSMVFTYMSGVHV